MGESRGQRFHPIPLVDFSTTLFSSLSRDALRCGDIDLAYRKSLVTASVEWKVELAGSLRLELLHERVEFWDWVVPANLSAHRIGQRRADEKSGLWAKTTTAGDRLRLFVNFVFPNNFAVLPTTTHWA